MRMFAPHAKFRTQITIHSPQNQLFGYGNSYLSPDTYTLMSRRQEKVNAIRRPEVGGLANSSGRSDRVLYAGTFFAIYINIFANRSVSGGCIGTVHTVAVRSYFSPVTYEYVPYH